MKKVVDLIRSLGDNEAYYTFEYFPPKTLDGLANLHARMERMVALRPTCVHVTWGAGGSTSDTSLELASMVQDQLAIPACLHLTCTNIERAQLDKTLIQAKELGITNILALRGDPPRGSEYWAPTDLEFQHAIDLVHYIRAHHGNTFCIGVAGYPEGSPEATQDEELGYLKKKVDAGAEFIVTQLFYDLENFLVWLDSCRDAGINVPIVPGIMPILSYDGFRRMTALTKTKVPQHIQSSLNPIKTNDEAVRDYGVALSVKMIKGLQARGIRAFHLCTLNLERSIARLVDELGWVESDNCEAAGPPTLTAGATGLVRTGLSAAWDEFPNGRFGDQRSPAFDLQAGYGAGSGTAFAHLTTDVHALWGAPTAVADITALFCAFAEGQLASTPWSEEPLALETSAITPFLLRLNRADWWTVASQPAVDGADSRDPVVGFGPEGGSVYQKAFVEFFVSGPELEILIDALERENRRQPDGVGYYRFYAGRSVDEPVRTNLAPGETNAVTWAVFRGAEVVTTTLIEANSFQTWKQEAFEIWANWARSQPTGTSSRKLLDELRQNRWLCTIVHHDYKEPEALWRFLINVLETMGR